MNLSYIDTLPDIFAHGMLGGGFINGLTHPVFGPDHLLAMVAVGILSAQIGGKAIWKVPLTFVGVMLFGGLLGISGFALPSVEQGIMFSVLALGVALALEKKLHEAWAMLFVGIFALCHGYAHGTEMPEFATPAFYALGFIIATTVLHISGVSIGICADKVKNGSTILRYVGAGMAGVGFAMLFGL